MFRLLRKPLQIFVIIFSHRFIPKNGKEGKIAEITIIYDLFDLD